MTHNLPRKAGTLLAALLLATGLAACGGSSDPQTDSTSPSSAQNEQLADASAAAAAPEDKAYIEAVAAKAKRKPSPCSSPTPVNVWEDVTPLQMKATGLGTWGPILSDPSRPATLFVSLDGAGLVRSPDCGLSWGRIDDPKYGFADPARSSSVATTMVIDPVNPNVLFMNNGYGQMGLFKSTNGGVDWQQAYGQRERSFFPYGGFTYLVAMDPTDPQHLVALPHYTCQGGQPSNCLLETKDGGATWAVLTAPVSISESGGLDLLDAKTWLFLNPDHGIYRTTDAGKTWSKVYSGDVRSRVYRSQANGGSYFLASLDGVLQSTDGISWRVIPGSPASTLLTGDGNRLFVAHAYATPQRYATAYEQTPSTWGRLAAPNVPTGGTGFTGAQALFADGVNGYLYSSNGVGGVWRMRTK